MKYQVVLLLLFMAPSVHAGDRWRPRPPIKLPPTLPPSSGSLLDEHNKVRAGLPAYRLQSQLQAAAEDHVKWMVSTGVFSHEGPAGVWHTHRATARGYRYSDLGENIAKGQRTAEECVGDWMRSPGHAANVRGKYIECGMAMAMDARGDRYWCGLYGRPATRGMRVAPEPQQQHQPPIVKSRRGWIR